MLRQSEQDRSRWGQNAKELQGLSELHQRAQGLNRLDWGG